MNKHLIAAGALTLAVAGGSAGAVAAQSTAPEIEFDVTAKAVKRAPGTQIPAGVAKLTFDRSGKGETGLALVRLNQGVTIEQFGAQVPKLKDPSDVHEYGRIVASTFIAGNDERQRREIMKKIKAGKEPRKEFAGPPSALVEIVSPQTRNDVEVNLREGKYLFVCFLQDSPKAKMHAQLGMQKVVTVK